MTPHRKPLLVYDGDCGFCRAWIARWRRTTGDRVDYAPSQEVAGRFPQLPAERFARAVQLLEPGGGWSDGAEAVFRALATVPGRGLPLWLYRRVPPFAAAAEWCYRLVAGHRPLFSRLTDWIWGPHIVPPGETLTAWLFLRALAVVYAIAFASLGVQVLGLSGSDGILPARELLQAVAERYGPERFWLLPTLCWLGAGDGTLVGLCVAGVALSAVLLAGLAPAPCLALLWALYLSLTSVCREFLWFQWDNLLLEAGFLAIFLAPLRWWSLPGSDPPPARAALWLLRLLLFKLMLSSAAVKLASGDPTWRNLTALQFHYETQCLPPWTAWHMHQLPAWLQRASALGMFAVEGLAPFLVFAPRRLRFLGAAAFAGLMVGIAATGNYGFFNLLTLALCLLLLDDGVWRRSAGGAPAGGGAGAGQSGASGRWPAWLLRPAAAALIATSLVPMLGAFRAPVAWLGPVIALYRAAVPFHTVNGYGLFAVMTTSRPEILLEGSDDGITWLPYEFRWKPGDVARRPGFVAPHQPRVDWQMWFAALSDYRREGWFLAFCERLLQGRARVLRLLAGNPFPGAPPRYLRATVWDYRFTDAATRASTRAWWRREPRGPYCPVLTLVQGRLAAAEGVGGMPGRP